MSGSVLLRRAGRVDEFGHELDARSFFSCWTQAIDSTIFKFS